MHLSFDLPNNCWSEALYCSCLILNGVPFRNSEKTTHEYWKNKNTSL